MNPLVNIYSQGLDTYELIPDDSASGAAWVKGVHHHVEDWVKLELTAEQMLQEELLLVRMYLGDEMTDVKDGLRTWEWMASQWLMGAADPSVVDWQLQGWWHPQSTDAH